MAGKSPVTASEEETAGLRRLAVSRDRGEADRARAVLLTLSGWTSPRIAEAFGVREDTVRLWRSDFSRAGVGVSGILCAGPGFHQVLTKRSSNMMANWVFASAHSRGGIFHSLAT